MKTVTINLYQFDELTEKAKQFAIEEHSSFLLNEGEECENEHGEIVTEYRDSISDEEVIESIKANEYYFFADGDMAHVCEYVDNHPTKAGITEFKFHGQTIQL